MEANEALSELNKILKMYDALKNAHKIVQVLADQEKYQQKLEAAIKPLESKVDELHVSHNSLVDAIEDHTDVLSSKSKAIKEMGNVYEDMLAEIKADVDAEETKLKAGMDARMNSMQRDMEAAKEQLEALRKQKADLFKDVENLNAQIKAAKDNIMKLAGAM